MKKLIIQVLLAIIAGHYCAAQHREARFSRLSVEDGLSQSSVMAIFQDSHGYIWMGTQDGLNRYNSVNFVTYRYNAKDSLTLPGNAITRIYEDSKHNIWVTTYSGMARYIPELDAFERIIVNPSETYDVQAITSIMEDRHHNIWLGTYRGAYKWPNGDRNKAEVVPYAAETGDRLGYIVEDIFEDTHGNIWVSTNDGLCKIITTGNKYQYVPYYANDRQKDNISNNYVTVVREDHTKNIWIGTRNGLNKLDTVTHSIIQYTTAQGLCHNNIRDILVDNKNNIWIATYRGLSVLNQKGNSFTNFIHNPENSNSLSDNSLHSLFQDKKGSIWIGTYFAGVNLFDEDNNRFTNFKHSNYHNSISYNIISPMIEDSKGNIWMGTEGLGLNYYDRQTNTFHHYLNQADQHHNGHHIKSLCIDHNSDLWVGTYQQGLLLQKHGTTGFVDFLTPPNVFSILEDSHQTLWIGTYSDGVWKLDRNANKFVRYDQPEGHPLLLSNNLVRVIYEDSRGNLWVGTQRGLNVKMHNSEAFKKFFSNPARKDGIGNDVIYAIKEDSKGRLWIGTYGGGLNLYDYEHGSFRKYGMEEGLPGNNIFGILEDGQGNLWISTNNGLAKFNPDTGYVVNFDMKDGLPGNEFNFNSYLRTSKGELFFGSKKGLTCFHPENIHESTYLGPIVFTGLKLFNKPIGINKQDGLLKKDISLTKTITFTHRQNVFAIDFALLNYLHPQKHWYAYKLKGFEKEWNYVNNPSATYTNLNHGSYTLLVKACNDDGVWTKEQASINIEILPPPWKTWWAYALYCIVLTGALALFRNFIRIREELRHDLELEHIEKEKEKELHEMKLQFFTNISHEIRTPLTLITAPVQNIMDKYQHDEFLQQQLAAVKNNTDRMLRLMNQLLDLRKQETPNTPLRVVEGNIVTFIQEIKLSFQETARLHNINYTLSTSPDYIPVWFDRQELEKVFYNLLSNAFKFTQDGGQISIHIALKRHPVNGEGEKKGSAIIQITDNGIGIPRKAQEKIFERFYQLATPKSNNGSGIGLALAKAIVVSHHGTISVTSIEQKANQPGFTTFTVQLPLGKEHFNEREIITDYSDSEELVSYTKFEPIPAHLNHLLNGGDIHSHAPTLLVVEDNDAIRKFVSDMLSEQYRVLSARNGVEGWDFVIKSFPDLIISDVIMPVMDGIELCRKVKTDERTSHIPVILLTARTSLIHQVTGYETGADDYMTKPFDVKLLATRIKNLITSRKQMREKFSGNMFKDATVVVSTSTDEKFLKKIVAIIEQNMQQDDFSVTVLAKQIGMSQPVLFRKIKALTNMNINDFIKSVKLNKAAQLLAQKELSIAAIANEVGYNNPKYFSKVFKEFFGKSPSQY